MPYNVPPTFLNGEHLSAYKLRLLAANDDYFSGVADRFEMCLPVYEPGANGAASGYTYFKGSIYLTQGTLKWAYAYSEAGAAPANAAIKLYIDKGLASEIILSSQTATGSYSGSTDVGALAVGLHTVELIGTWDYYAESGPWPTAMLEYCHEVYDPAGTPLAYAVPNSFTDGNTSALADFTKLTDNDLYFRAVEPGNHPFAFAEVNLTAGGIPGWKTWFKHRAGCPRMYYKNVLPAFDITIDPGGIGEVVTLTATAESYHDLVGAFVDGTWYQITSPAGGGAIEVPAYIGFGRVPGTAPAGFTPLGEFSPGAFVWGTTANQKARLELLKSNDVDIAARLTPADYAGRRHVVMATPGGDAGSNKSYTTTYYFKHLLPVLSYTGTGAVMTWGADNSLTLPTPTGAMGKMDLASISSLVVGQVYKITGATWCYEDLT
jgi:hypothetical protein